MQLFLNLLAALSLLLPGAGQEMVQPVGVDNLRVTWAEMPCDFGLLIHRPADVPSPTRLLIEGLDESALGEEESDEINSSTLISEMVFGETSFSTLLFSPSSPHTLH